MCAERLERDNLMAGIMNSAKGLSDHQLFWVARVAEELSKKYSVRLVNKGRFTEEFVLGFGDILRIHHCFSNEPFTKDKFEYAMESAINHTGGEAELAPRGHKGHDIRIGKQKFSLKTEAHVKISANIIWISKAMELGEGEWETVEDLQRMLQRFYKHLEDYDSILLLRDTSRFLTKQSDVVDSNQGMLDIEVPAARQYQYELVEIPKALLLEAQLEDIVFSEDTSKENTKPGSCKVLDENGNTRFKYYFDGAAERKLQIQSLRKSLCTVHATWKFQVSGAISSSR